MEQDLTNQEKIQLLEKEIDGLELGNRLIGKALNLTNIELAEAKKKIIGLEQMVESWKEQNNKLVNQLFRQAEIIQSMRSQYRKPPEKISFTEWLFGKWK